MSADSIVIRCPSCQKQFKGPVKLAGRQVKCPACKNVIAVPAIPEPEPVSVTENDGAYDVAPSSSWDQPTYATDPYAQQDNIAMDPSGPPQYSAPPYGAPPLPPATHYAPPAAPGTYYAPPMPGQMPAAGYGDSSVPPPAASYNNKKKGRGGSQAKIIGIVAGAVVLIGAVVLGLTLIQRRSVETEKKIVGRWRMARVNNNDLVGNGSFGNRARVVWDFRADNTVIIAVEGGPKPSTGGKGQWNATTKLLSITLDKNSELAKAGGGTISKMDILRAEPKLLQLQERNSQGDIFTFSRDGEDD